MADTKIEWTGKTWNPIRTRNTETGEVGWFCEHVSHGCDHCYAEKMNINTYFGNGLEYKASNLPKLELFLDEKILEQPLRWRNPTKIFPCSMTDLFGRFVPDEWIIAMFRVMAQASRHTFQVLTKRPERMRELLADTCVEKFCNKGHFWAQPRNVWLGVSVEDQKTADERIPLLLETPAAVRWISAEPLLSAIDFSHDTEVGPMTYLRDYQLGSEIAEGLDWVVVGGESGSKARRCAAPWIRSVVKQCRAANVPVFVKQLGGFVIDRNDAGFDGSDESSWPIWVEENDALEYDINGYREAWQGADVRVHLRNRKGGDINEWPEDLRVRDFPN